MNTFLSTLPSLRQAEPVLFYPKKQEKQLKDQNLTKAKEVGPKNT
jgi:hypothetical protein